MPRPTYVPVNASLRAVKLLKRLSYAICPSRLGRTTSREAKPFRGQATDIDIHAKEILRMRDVINKLYAKHTGLALEKIEKDVERDLIMSSEEAKAYGLVDEIIDKHR